MDLRPRGKTILKPNLVIAHGKYFKHAYTRAEVAEGVLLATRQRGGDDLESVRIAERCGITIPTRMVFSQAGYRELARRHKVELVPLDETTQVEVPLKHPDRLRDFVYTPEPIASCDFMISMPKFKAHPWTTVTLSLKNFIGIQDDPHRLLDHNTFLEHKIVDLNLAARQDFIAIDGITAGQKMMLTPEPFDLGAIVLGVNPCAVDTVGCAMVGVDPADLIHLKMAAAHGVGPMSLDQIEVTGDFPLEEVQRRTVDFQFCLERVDSYFAGGPLTCTVGTFPEAHSRDYCWGGCPGALQEAVHILRGFDPAVESKMGRVRYVVGKVEGPLDLAPDEKVLFAGACTSWEGEIDGQAVRIESSYRPPGQHDPHHRPSNDMLLKTATALGRCLASRGRRWLHAPACTMSVADHVHYLSYLAGVSNPNFDLRLLAPVNLAYWRMRAGRLLGRLAS